MLIPKKVKHRKWHKRAGMSGRVASRTAKISFGEYGLQAKTASWLTSRQIEAARRVMVRALRKGGKMWIRVFPDKPVTQKGNETPMGSGKGAVDHYVVSVLPGTVMFEIAGIEEDKAREAMELAAYKLPLKAKFIKK